ncbi:hypothetical protein [Streptomyces dysideae]|uniref:Uncharacterized protein n=1 Tax=Streptomyces dysideae TaxID=909626 RepID=A0A117S1G5_9ACTN|nr:hypothetical protein [Streptomyces dysideae]KUO21472.1 hypothetical protein AQJ91_09055 [Streptomyces dysideae]
MADGTQGPQVEERWLDTGSGPGRVVQVYVYPADPVETARRALKVHLENCGECAPDSWCPVSDRLYAAYRGERGPAS